MTNSGGVVLTPAVPSVFPGSTPAAYPAPLLPLDTWRRIMGYNPWHFWGWAGSIVPVRSACNTLLTEYAWQNADASGRSELRMAIMQAENRMCEELGFSVAPHFVSDASIQYPRYFDATEMYMAGIDGAGRRQGVWTREKKLQKIGVESLTLIGNAPVTLSDLDGDGLKESFTLAIATTVTDIAEIAVYFSAGDRFTGEDPSDRWRINPVRVSIAGGVATIKGNAWLLARPVLYEGVLGPVGIDPLVSGNFAGTLDVYRRFCDPTGQTTDTAQVTLEWGTAPYPQWAGVCCGPTPTFNPGNGAADPAAIALVYGRAGIRDKELGEIEPGAAVYDTGTGTWYETSWGICRPPDRLTVRYLAGWPLDNDGQFSREWEQSVARMAAAEMTHRPCACETANREWSTWAFDVSRAAGANDEQYTVSREDLTNPFGTRRGHIDAWRKVRSMRIFRGMPQ